MRPIKTDWNSRIICVRNKFWPIWGSPDSVEGCEALLDGVGRPRRLAVGVSDAHDGQLRAEPGHRGFEMRLMDLMRCAMGEIKLRGEGGKAEACGRLRQFDLPPTVSGSATMRRQYKGIFTTPVN